MMKKMKMMFVMALGLVLMFTSCGDQHKAQSLVKDFLDENLVDQDCSYERFSRLTPTAMINFEQMKAMRQNVSKLPYVKNNIDYNDTAYPDTLLYLRATYKLTDNQGKKQEVTQTFYLDKGLPRVIGFKEN